LIQAAFAILVMVGVIVTSASLWFRYAVYEDRSLPTAAVDIVIDRGASFGAVVAELEHRGVLAHPLAFRVLARMRGTESDVKAGEYLFDPHQSSDEILQRIVGGEQSAVWITIPEGFTAEQIAQAFAAHDISSEQQLTAAFRGHEGFLFPSTYLVPVGLSATGVERMLSTQFARELPRDAAARAKALGYSIPQIVTIASLIEREAKSDDERGLMAGVYYNRLKRGMPLQVDASIEYALPEHHTVITGRDLAIDSPYNTYRHTGLPPTPIANPGKPSLDAAFHPVASDYLYYVYKGDGHHAFAKTLAEHDANVARYLK
jgi:UPF0755 protein